MLYLFHGPDSYGRHKKINSLVEAIRKKYPQTAADTFFLDENGELERLYEFVVPKTLFESSKRVAIVRESKDTEGKLIEKIIFLSVADKECAVIFDEEWEKNKIPGFLSKYAKDSQTKTFYFPELADSQTYAWAAKEAKEAGTEIDLGALKFLLRATGNDLWACANELKKLSFLNKSITLSVLAERGEYHEEGEIFEFSRAIGYGNLSQKLSIWEQLLFQKADFYMVVNYLAKAAGTLPLIKKIADVDVSIKTGRLEPQQALLGVLLG